MCGYVSKNLGFSSSSMKMEEEGAMFFRKQGIVSVLGSDSNKKSLRRTFSADISSKEWVFGNGISSPVKKIPSLEEFAVSETTSRSEKVKEDGEVAEDSKSRFDIWNSIQEQRKNKEEEEKDGIFQSWSSILSEKPQENLKALPPPYVHPLVKRRSRSLSQRSLEICTESLGSETGSDVFLSYPPSDVEGSADYHIENAKNSNQAQEEEKEIPQEKVMRHEESVKVAKYSFLGGKKPLQRSFPPPIPSLSRENGVSTRMTTRRDNGRLVLEASSVVSENNFCAKRQDGRLVLTFTNASIKKVDKEEEMNQEVKKISKEEDEETQKEKIGLMMEQKVPKFSSGLISFHRLAVVMNKSKGLTYRNPSWRSKFDKIAKPKGKNFEEEEEEKQTNSQPVAYFNGYEYYWGAKLTSKDHTFNKNKVFVTSSRVGEENQKQLVVLTRKNANEIVPLMLEKESFWIWKSCCTTLS